MQYSLLISNMLIATAYESRPRESIRSKIGAMHSKQQLLEFGLRLKRRREARDLTRSALAELAGITRTTLRALENGAQHPEPSTMARLASALQTSEEALTGTTPIEADDPLLARLTDEDLEVAQAFHHAPTRIKQRVLGVLQERAERGEPSTTVVATVADWARRLQQLGPGKRQAIALMIAELEGNGGEKPAATTDRKTKRA